MNLLQFDTSASADEELDGAGLDELAPKLEELHAELADLANPIQNPSARLVTDDRCFFRLPEHQYADYVSGRDASDLGRVFQIANGLHDDIDSVIVLGEPAMTAGARALMRACCDPFHNELSRAERGSKPRMYFQPNPEDTDAISSVLSRLQNENAEIPAEKSWATVCLRGDESCGCPDVTPSRLKAELRKSNGTESRMKRDFVSIGISNGIDEKIDFRLPRSVATANSVLSPAGLLPAAMLGLDCMKLLEGAVVINQHFRDTPIAQNVVMRFAASNVLSTNRGRRRRVISAWSEALASFGTWYDELVFHAGLAEIEVMVMINPRNHDRLQSICRHRCRDSIVHHLVVGQSRCDPVRNAESGSMDQAMDARFRQSFDGSAVPQTSIHLPLVDPFTLGQCFQLAMIATWIESRLAAESDSKRDQQTGVA